MEASSKRRFYIRILEKTEEGFVSKKDLKEGFRITDQLFSLFLSELERNGEIVLQEDLIKLDLTQRLSIANNALKLGADFERVSYSLGWLEFEELTGHIFKENGFSVAKRFRFQANKRRWEIDVLAFRAPIIVCAECKHWKKGVKNSSARQIIEDHIQKVNIFTENLVRLSTKINIIRWNEATVFPVIITLLPPKYDIYRRVPVIPVLKLPSFIDQFESYRDRLIHKKIDLPGFKVKPEQTILRV
jgi:(2Fe-2S) ferredoxin